MTDKSMDKGVQIGPFGHMKFASVESFSSDDLCREINDVSLDGWSVYSIHTNVSLDDSDSDNGNNTTVYCAFLQRFEYDDVKNDK